MMDLSMQDMKALANAVGLDIPDPDLYEVTEVVNAVLEELDKVDIPGLEKVEPLPIILPKGGS